MDFIFEIADNIDLIRSGEVSKNALPPQLIIPLTDLISFIEDSEPYNPPYNAIFGSNKSSGSILVISSLDKYGGFATIKSTIPLNPCSASKQIRFTLRSTCTQIENLDWLNVF